MEALYSLLIIKYANILLTDTPQDNASKYNVHFLYDKVKNGFTSLLRRTIKPDKR
jgi:hypothetical protein